MSRTNRPTTCVNNTLLPLPPSSSSNPILQVSNHFFGPVPSQSEVDFAISVLENFVAAVSPNQSKPEWVVQLLNSATSKLLISHGLQRLFEAFQLWQTDPFVKRLVVSLASDKAFWDAIMKNELVRELRNEPLCLANRTGEACTRNVTGIEVDVAETIFQRICEITKAKVMEFIESFQSLMNKMFRCVEIENQSPVHGCADEQLKEKVASSFLLSVLIILIVIVVRVA